jgi:pyruvate dehydrogenase E2 component (dihydrolipoamide acetyltransferase)
MPIEIQIQMPRLVDSMTEGAVVAWRVREGEPVTAGMVIAEIEVDKATGYLEAPEAGTLTRIVVPASSEKVEVGAVLAILEPGGSPTPTVVVVEEPVSRSVRGANGTGGHPEQTTGRDPDPVQVSLEPMLPQVEVDASPLARSMALQAGFELSSLQGTGPAGRIMQADVLTALGFHRTPEQVRPRSPVVAASGQYLPASSADFDEIPHSRVRQVIAQRLGESKRTIPHFYLEVTCRIDALLRLRSEIQAASADGIKLSLNDFAVRAAALALRKLPDANASWTEAATRRYWRINLAIAVATDAGLVAPIVRDADRKGLSELTAELRDLVRRARDGRLRPEELEGGTFTVSNLGMYGVDSLYAIVNPPQAGILGLGAAESRPVVVDGSITIATTMNCTLSADHRVLDGATGARFLSIFKSLIEQPLTMMSF